MANVEIKIQTSALAYKAWINTSYIGLSLKDDKGNSMINETELGIDQPDMFDSILREAAREVLKVFLSRQGDLDGSLGQSQIDEVTVSGTSGEGVVHVASHDFSIDFVTDLAATVDYFESLHDQALDALGITVKSDGVDKLKFTGGIGVPFASPALENTSGDISGVTANIQPSSPPMSSAIPFEQLPDYVVYRFKEAEPVLHHASAIKDSLTEDVENAIYTYTTAMWMKNKGNDNFLEFLMSKFAKFTSNINVHLYKLHD